MRAFRPLFVATLAAASALLPAVARAQGAPSSRQALALELITLTRVSESIVAGIEANLAAQRMSAPQVPAEFWDLFLTRAKGGADSLARLIAPVYVEAFTEQELRDLLAFYRTPLGQRLIERQPMILTRSSQIGQQWGAALGMAVAQELQARQRPPE